MLTRIRHTTASR